ncbi:MAG: site-2 protease family protein [Candidatus Shapirobacteria bacterium]
MINLTSLLILILAITIHEFSHALAADKLGDPTPRSFGRLTLNPIAHADPVGTVLLPLLSALSGIPTIGWAKPVPIDPFNFRHPKRDMIITSLAGPASNLLIAIIFGLISNIFHIQNIFIYLFILINISLAIFNLIPIPPLDGSKILINLLPSESGAKWEEALNRYGFILLIILVFLPISNGHSLLTIIISPVINFIFGLLIPGFLGV